MPERRVNPILAALMQGSVSFQRVFLMFGGPNVALMLSQACYWQTTKDTDDMWYKQETDWFDECGLTRKMLLSARSILVDFGVLEHTVKGCPATSFYRVNEEVLSKYLSGEISKSPNYQVKPVRPKGANWNARKVRTSTPEKGVLSISTESTTKNTTKNTDTDTSQTLNKRVKLKPANQPEPDLLSDEPKPLTKSQLREHQLRENHRAIHLMAGLPEPSTLTSRDRAVVAAADIKGVTNERLAAAWAHAIKTSELKYWPLHCVFEKLHMLEYEMANPVTKIVRRGGRLSQDEIQASSDDAWNSAFGGALVCDQK